MTSTHKHFRAQANHGVTMLARPPAPPPGTETAGDVGLHTRPHLAVLDDPWPDRPYREGYGWPLWIPPTSKRAYISGSFRIEPAHRPGGAPPRRLAQGRSLVVSSLPGR